MTSQERIARKREYTRKYAQTPHGKEVIKRVQQRRRLRLQEEQRRAAVFQPPPQFRQQFKWLKEFQERMK